MREDRHGVRCDMGFGKNAAEVLAICQQRGSLPPCKFVAANNPMPTGDHWKVIEWVMDFRKRGQSFLTSIPASRRPFVKAASAALSDGGFYMEIASLAAREFRDKNGLRMQRGKVYVFVSLLPKEKNDEPAEGVTGDPSVDATPPEGIDGLVEPPDLSVPAGDPSPVAVDL